MGFIIEAVFLVHLSIELWQDKKINKYYQQHRNIKIIHNNGKYECGNCGNINIKCTDTECMICGIHFQNIENKNPQDILNQTNKKK